MKRSLREADIRRRVRRWRQVAALWWLKARDAAGIPPPNANAIRLSVATFRRLTVGQRISLTARDYGDLSDQDFLLRLLDEATRRADHAAAPPPQPSVPAVTPATGLIVIPRADGLDVFAWNAAIAAADMQAAAAFARGITARAHIFDLQKNVLGSIAALRRAVPSMPAAAQPLPPTDQPPFTVG